MRRVALKTVRKFVTACIAGACAAGLTACGGGGSAPAAGGSEGEGLTYPKIVLGQSGKDIKTSIKLFNHKTDMAVDTYPGKNWKQYVADFNKMYPNIKVQVETDTNYASDALTRLQGKNWGDMMMIPAVDKADLATYFLSFGTKEAMSKQIRWYNQSEYGGQVYGIPSNGNGLGIVYNKRIYKEAGITAPPRTPDEFIAALKAIKEKTKSTPLYTNYAAGWTMGAWDGYIGVNATGDAKYQNQELLHTKNPFSDPKDGTHAYNVYKILYDAVAQGLTENDYSTTDWESSKGKINSGDIATMVLGAWAVSQCKNAGNKPDDVGYMPFPISVGGKQYTVSAGDYAFGINKNSDKDHRDASMIFIKWMTEKSGFAKNEGGIPTELSDTSMPDAYSEFKDVKFLEDLPAVKGEEDLGNTLNSDSELAINTNGNARIQTIVEHASKKDKSYDDLVKEWNGKWNDALKTEGVDVKYDTVVK